MATFRYLSQITTCSNQKILAIPSEAKTSNYQSPSRMKTLILSSSQDIRIFSSEDPLKTGIPVDWHTTQTPDSPTVVPGFLIFNNQEILAIPCSSQGITFPGSSQDSFISSHPGFIYPQQDSSSAYMHIHHIHIINIDITYIASCIMTLNTTNSLPFQERSVDRQRSSSSEIHPEIVQM